MTEIVEKYRKQINSILDRKDWSLTLTEHNFDFSEKLDTGTYMLTVPAEDDIDTPIVVSTFELVPMINCCGIVVSTRSVVDPNFRNRGIATLLNSFRIDVARHLGYGVLLCTTVDSNEYQQKVLEANGWSTIHKFVNPRTKNTLNIQMINL